MTNVFILSIENLFDVQPWWPTFLGMAMSFTVDARYIEQGLYRTFAISNKNVGPLRVRYSERQLYIQKEFRTPAPPPPPPPPRPDLNGNYVHAWRWERGPVVKASA